MRRATRAPTPQCRTTPRARQRASARVIPPRARFQFQSAVWQILAPYLEYSAAWEDNQLCCLCWRFVSTLLRPLLLCRHKIVELDVPKLPKLAMEYIAGNFGSFEPPAIKSVPQHAQTQTMPRCA